jgi:kynurenine formamidase
LGVKTPHRPQFQALRTFLPARMENIPGDFPFGSSLSRARVVDLSYAITADLPSWPGDPPGFTARVVSTIEKDGAFARSFSILEHYGTHLDAPVHFVPGGLTVDEIPPERLFGPAVIFDVRDAAAADSDYELGADRVAAWESARGPIPAGAIVLLRTGWASRWPDAQRYSNPDAAGTMHFPGFGVGAVRILIERHAAGIGADTMSVDHGRSPDFPVHRLALGAGLFQLENLADLGAVPETGAFLFIAPIKLRGGSGGPCRVFAILP